ncbi:g48 [Coccomyxa elongata]
MEMPTVEVQQVERLQPKHLPCGLARLQKAGGCSVHSGPPSTTTGLKGMARERRAEAIRRPDCSRLQPLSREVLEYFIKRGISQATLERNGVKQEFSSKHNAHAIAFPYYRDGEVINIKYRTLDKKFWQTPGTERILYGVDDVKNAAEIIIVEGEMDKLALEEAGMRNVISVPDGAPRAVKEGELPPPEADTKFQYLWNCRAVLDQAVRIVLATDSDAPGQALAEELARRLGRDRCWRVRWPSEAAAASDDGAEQGGTSAARKDANEVLLKDGPEALQALVQEADPYPIRGLFKFSDFLDEIWSMYDEQDAMGQGVSTGWSGLDSYYRVVPGELSIVTGVPNSGKSEWIDALLCNLATQHGWSFAMCSMEKKVKDHARQLLEKYIGKPFLDAKYAGKAARMGPQDVEEGLQWLEERFHVVRCEDDELPSVDWVLGLARAAVLRYGIRGLVIDPYNELDHQRPVHMNETEYVSQMLTKIKRFAQHNDVHVWFVAHPRQLQGWKGEPPNLYDISGSAHFINKADNGIVIHRNRDPEQGALNHVKVLVRKVRNKAAGTIGDCILEYDRITGRYKDVL